MFFFYNPRTSSCGFSTLFQANPYSRARFNFPKSGKLRFSLRLWVPTPGLFFVTSCPCPGFDLKRSGCRLVPAQFPLPICWVPPRQAFSRFFPLSPFSFYLSGVIHFFFLLRLPPPRKSPTLSPYPSITTETYFFFFLFCFRFPSVNSSYLSSFLIVFPEIFSLPPLHAFVGHVVLILGFFLLVHSPSFNLLPKMVEIRPSCRVRFPTP